MVVKKHIIRQETTEKPTKGLNIDIWNMEKIKRIDEKSPNKNVINFLRLTNYCTLVLYNIHIPRGGDRSCNIPGCVVHS